MQVKCIHDLCSLLGHILVIWWFYEDLDLFAIDFGGFLNDPLSFGFNTAKQIFLYLHVFDFQGPFERQTFCHILFSGNRRPWEEVNGGATKQELGGHHTGPHVGHMVSPISSLEHCFDAILESTDSCWPKTDYIYPLLAILQGCGGETWNTRYKYVDCEDRRGDPARTGSFSSHVGT
jgi:hypothetical protein